MVEVKGFIGAPANNCLLPKVLGNSNCVSMGTIDPIYTRDPIFIRSSNEGAPGKGAEIKSTRSPTESQRSMRGGSKVMRKVSAFGPAHAEQARKLYQIKRTQHEKRLQSFESTDRSHVQLGHYITISKHDKAQVSTQGVHLPKDPVQYEQRVKYTNSGGKRVPALEMHEPNQPILKIVTIAPRPNKESTGKLKISSEVEHVGKSREVFEKEQPSKLGDKIQKGPCITILQILSEIFI